jgi:WD40 repeat protein
VMVLQGHSDLVNRVLLPQPGQALSGAGDHTLRLWDLDSGKSLRVFKGHIGAVVDAALLDNNEYALSASADSTLRLWNLDTGHCLHILRGHTSAVRRVIVLPGSQQALSTAYDHTLRLWDLHTGESLAVLHLDESPMCLACLNERFVAVGDDTGKVRVIEIVWPST